MPSTWSQRDDEATAGCKTIDLRHTGRRSGRLDIVHAIVDRQAKLVLEPDDRFLDWWCHGSAFVTDQRSWLRQVGPPAWSDIDAGTPQ